MKISPRERMLILLGTGAVLVALVWNFLTPPNAQAASKAGSLSVAEAQRKQDTALNELKALQKQEEELQPKIAKYAYKRSAEELVPRLIRDLQRMAKQANISLTEIKPQKSRPVAGTSLDKVLLDIRFRAPFQPNVMHFFYLIEAPEGKMVLEKFNIVGADPRLKTVEVSAQIAVFTRVQSGATGETPNATNL
jgi:hypothetical protein